MCRIIEVTIKGPQGSGKTTLGDFLGKAMNVGLVDSAKLNVIGVLYRDLYTRGGLQHEIEMYKKSYPSDNDILVIIHEKQTKE